MTPDRSTVGIGGLAATGLRWPIGGDRGIVALRIAPWVGEAHCRLFAAAQHREDLPPNNIMKLKEKTYEGNSRGDWQLD